MRKPRPAKKPRFTVRPQSYHFLRSPGCDPIEALIEIDEYVRYCDVRGMAHLQDVASDVLDGWAIRRELKPFFRQKLMVKVRHDDYEDQRAAGIAPEDEDRCGGRWTVMFTERAVRIFWPDRI